MDSRKALKRLAARGPAASETGPGLVVERRGAKLRRACGEGVEETLLLGAACSEVFSGPSLAKVLRPALELQLKAVEALEKGEAWEPLSIHTSAGFPRGVADFLEALEPQLPWQSAPDWLVNFQLEGTTAVWAGVEALAHLRALAPHPKSSAGALTTCLVGVAESSYHGARSTGLGQPAAPRWPNAPRTLGQAAYPLPDKEPQEYLRDFEVFLEQEVGVVVFEPQWGSSNLGRTWPPELLRDVIQLCQRKGAYVLCDEVMCGLGRHGQGSLFLSGAWQLQPDAVTFGKSVASGTFPLSGVVLRDGSPLVQKGVHIMQSHTYAAANSLAFTTAAAVLRELPAWEQRAKEVLGKLVEEILGPVAGQRLKGQGLLWGVEVSGEAETLRKACHEEGVWPYIVAGKKLGFMISPPMDIEEAHFREGLGALRRVLKRLEGGLER